jgi:serine/threonine protein kinase
MKVGWEWSTKPATPTWTALSPSKYCRQKVADPERKCRFVQEAKAASALNHPNIIAIHDIASENGIDFIVMEYVQGKTLDALVPRKGLRLNEILLSQGI